MRSNLAQYVVKYHIPLSTFACTHSFTCTTKPLLLPLVINLTVTAKCETLSLERVK